MDDVGGGEVADHVIRVPSGPDLLCTVTAVIPLQLLAYHVATFKGTDVDQPRNLVHDDATSSPMPPIQTVIVLTIEGLTTHHNVKWA